MIFKPIEMIPTELKSQKMRNQNPKQFNFCKRYKNEF